MRLIDADELIKYIKIWEIGTSISSDQKEFVDCVNRQFTREKEDIISPAQYGAFLQKRGKKK